MAGALQLGARNTALPRHPVVELGIGCGVPTGATLMNGTDRSLPSQET